MNYGDYDDTKFACCSQQTTGGDGLSRSVSSSYTRRKLSRLLRTCLWSCFRLFISRPTTDGIVPVTGSGIAMPYIPWTYYKMTAKLPPLLSRPPQSTDIHTLNPFATGSRPQLKPVALDDPTFVIRNW